MPKSNKKVHHTVRLLGIVMMIIAACPSSAGAQTARASNPANQSIIPPANALGTDHAGEFIVTYDKANVVLGLPKDARPQIMCGTASNGKEFCEYRLNDGPAVAIDPALIPRLVDSGTPAPGAEAALRAFIENAIKGKPEYATMTADVAEQVRTEPKHPDLGALKSLTFLSGPPWMATTRFMATYENGRTAWDIALDASGKIAKIFNRQARIR